MSREFFKYFAARQSAVAAFTIEDIAVAWQIYSLRHSALDLGLVGLILFLPQLLLALPAGVLADRFDRRSICMTSCLFEAVGLFGFVALIFVHVHTAGTYFGAVAFIGIAHTFGVPAQRSLLVNIVSREEFVRAQALTSSATEFVAIAGPAVAGLLVGIAPWIAFAAAAVCYGIGGFAYALLPRRAAASSPHEPVLRAALQGIRFIFKQRIILGAISLDLFAVLFGGATALLPVFATSILHVGAFGFGVLRAAPAAGAALVAIYIARHSIARRAGPLLLGCVFGFGAATIVFGISRNFWLSVIALMCTGGFDMISVVVRNALVQLRTLDEMRGRVGAVENIFIGASNELGAFESGGVASLVGPIGSVVLGGVATIVVIACWSVLFPELRSLDRLA